MGPFTMRPLLLSACGLRFLVSHLLRRPSGACPIAQIGSTQTPRTAPAWPACHSAGAPATIVLQRSTGPVLHGQDAAITLVVRTFWACACRPYYTSLF
ncbi:hypothetical protein BD289DRAFT_440031 [Coniella lustricola]|uniref:Secreted protein n=1 Tax=Coniella lustricola TaxID=2025994 RepID=A0A2T3A0W5_9PEZI|nr:hypothetical protein BD289DRAFT_440031 [Coniella lustricola]